MGVAVETDPQAMMSTDAAVHSEPEDSGAPLDAGASSTPHAGGVADAGSAVDSGAMTPVDAGLMVDAGPSLVEVFVMIGKQGRRAISCDDGTTWVNDVAFDDALAVPLRYRCWAGDFVLPDGGTQSTDCDHNGWSSTSLTALDGVLMHTMGWGAPGTFHRSTDGVSWANVFTGANVQGILAGPTRWVSATRSSKVSTDRGLTWANGPEVMLANGTNTIWNVRGGGVGGGTMIVVAQDGQNTDWQISRDEGVTWHRPTLVGGGRVDGCGAASPVFGNGVWVSASWNNTASRMVMCRSTDNGATWSLQQGPNEYIESRVLWTGSTFMAWSNSSLFRSTDGLTWTSTRTMTRRDGALVGGSPNIGAVARNPTTGTFAAVRGGWNVWYQDQRFYRSSDGITWDELPESAARRSHPVTHMVFARVQRSTVCR